MTWIDPEPLPESWEYDRCFDPITGLLDISCKDLLDWPFTRSPPPGVAQIDVAMNRFSRIPEAIVGCGKLRALVMFGNRIVKIPDSIRRMQGLRSLDLRMNPVRYISHRIGELKELRELHVTGGCLEAVPEQIGDVDLRDLTLGNELTSVPACIARCRRLRMLRLSENRLRELPPELGTLGNLSELGVDNNLLRDWPDSFHGLRALRWLHAEGNPLRQLPWFVLDLPMMQGLSCCDFLVSLAEARRFSHACLERGVSLLWNRDLRNDKCYAEKQYHPLTINE